MSHYAMPPDAGRDRLCSFDGGIGEIAAIASIASSGVGALGAINSGAASAAQARFQAQVAANNQIIAEQNAQYATKAGEASAYDQGLRNRQVAGRLVAGLSAEGVDVSTGSAAQAREGQQQTGLTDVERVRQEAALRAYGYRTQSSNFGAEAALLRAQAPQDVTAGFLKAGGTLLSGISSLSGKLAGLTPSLYGNQDYAYT